MVGIGVYMIGNEANVKALEDAFLQLQPGNRCLLIGPSGIGKTTCVEELCKKYGWECIKIDSVQCASSKELMDRWMKLHRWKDMGHFQDEPKKRLILIDELETLIKIDRNIPSSLIKCWNQSPNHLPCILVGQYEADKKIGELKKMCQAFYWQGLTVNDLVQHFKKQLPAKQLKEICQKANGSFYAVQQAIQQRSIVEAQDDVHRIEEIFQLKKATNIHLILMEDPWIHPLKVIENANKIYHLPVYVSLLKDFLFIDQWMYVSQDDPSWMLSYFSEILVKYNETIYTKKPKPITMEFTKLLSSISTQKKIQRSIYEKTAHSIPLFEIGYYWATQFQR